MEDTTNNLSPLGAEMVAGLSAFCDTLEANKENAERPAERKEGQTEVPVADFLEPIEFTWTRASGRGTTWRRGDEFLQHGQVPEPQGLAKAWQERLRWPQVVPLLRRRAEAQEASARTDC